MKIAQVNEFFQTDYYNAACTSWIELDPYEFLPSHPTRQAEYVVYDETDNNRIVDHACRHCYQRLLDLLSPA